MGGRQVNRPDRREHVVRALVQRVSEAEVHVAGDRVAAIGPGLLVFVGVTHVDTGVSAATLARKVSGLRILSGERSVLDTPGSAVLAVSHFTLYGDTRKGRRPSWSAAAPGVVARPLFDAFVREVRALGINTETGVFGADMRVSLCNEGPMTVLVEI